MNTNLYFFFLLHTHNKRTNCILPHFYIKISSIIFAKCAENVNDLDKIYFLKYSAYRVCES